MKRIAALAMSLIMIFSVCTFSVSAARITNANDVGAVGDEISLAPGFSADQLKQVRKLIKEEYNRGIKTRSVKHKGRAYFDYGNSTGEYVHAWVGSERTTGDGETLAAAGCMNQDFTGGYSDSLEVLGQGANWCCILVTTDSLAKGEAYTVRDGIANKWGSEGGTNSFWGLPTSNQYWVGNICYQRFERGYASSENGQLIFTEFHAISDEEYVQPPALPGAGSSSTWDNDFGQPAPDDGGQDFVDTEVPDLPAGITITVKEPEAPTPADENQDGETQDGENQDGENQDGENQEQTASAEETDGDTAEVASQNGKTSSKVGGTLTTTTYFLGMELTPELQRNLIIGGIALAVLIIAIIVVIIVLVKKKKAKATAGAEEAPVEEAPAEEAPAEEAAADEEPKDEENK